MKKYLPYLLYFILAGLIMRPFFSPGFLFFLDMAWGPRIDLTDYLANGLASSFPLAVIFKFLSFFMAVELTQKLLLWFILFFAASAMYGFARSYMKIEWAIGSGLFYLINPYVYERFLAGQWLVLLGYGFFPLAFKLFLEFILSFSN